MKLYDKNGGPQYVRLDDDVSFQILRTNPKLTTNTKLVYDGKNLYMDAYQATPLLSTMEYKHHKVWRTGLYNRDIRNFLYGSNTSAYALGQSVEDTIVLNDFDNQFENMYWCGVESINSELYPQEMGCIAPLYLRKKRPNYFVIFRVDTPANTNTNVNRNDLLFNFYADVKSQMKIIKTFDLREGTPIGDYIKRYVEQKNFKYDKSVYVNFSSNEIYYYGIDKGLGVLTEKVENIEEQMLKNDNTILKGDDWITSGFERNNLIFPYIINFEFLFDDKDISEYKFARYFGMYCNDIDMYDLNVDKFIHNIDKTSKEKSTTLITKLESDDDYTIQLNSEYTYYIKDKYNDIFSIRSTFAPGFFDSPGHLNENDFTGFETSSVSTYAEKLPGVGYPIMILEITKPLEDGDKIYVIDSITNDKLGEFIAIDNENYGPGDFYANIFSCKGSLNDIAYGLAGTIRNTTTDQFEKITAFSIDNKVVIKSMYPGTVMNDFFYVTFDEFSSDKIKKVTQKFDGGTDYNGCMLKVYTSDTQMFFDDSEIDRDSFRYIKCGSGRVNAKILSVIPYITDDNKIDDTYSVLITDNYGQYISISESNQIEIIDKFYAKLGALSYFPVRDFDFDTISSQYGECTLMKNELNELNLGNEFKYSRFYDYNGNDVDTEYDYFCENLVPELTVVNKTVPSINKWGYIDEGKDSCENPYRLNTSKIFDSSNFSANTFMQRGDITEYTYSMPYYVTNDKNGNVNEYQYLPYNTAVWDASLGNVKTYFTQESGEDPFDAVFGDTSSTNFKSKRFNKKYSRFLLGDDVNRSSTLFRGVKFEISEIVNGKEVKTGKYNDYRFSIVYVPVLNNNEDEDNHTIHFIKNDKFKFIVGVIYFYMKSNEYPFNKGYVYSGSMGYINPSGTENSD